MGRLVLHLLVETLLRPQQREAGERDRQDNRSDDELPARSAVGLLRRRQTVRVDYEKALRHGLPAALQPLLGDLPLEGRDLASRTDNNHSVAGNAMPQATTVRLDEEWRSALGRGPALVIQLLCLPLLARYGLRLRGS